MDKSNGGPRPPQGGFPLTKFMVALMKMTPEQRAKASAEKAAARYGLPVDWCDAYIRHWRSVT